MLKRDHKKAALSCGYFFKNLWGSQYPQKENILFNNYNFICFDDSLFSTILVAQMNSLLFLILKDYCFLLIQRCKIVGRYFILFGQSISFPDNWKDPAVELKEWPKVSCNMIPEGNNKRRPRGKSELCFPGKVL